MVVEPGQLRLSIEEDEDETAVRAARCVCIE
jgi:hypothetical protein